MSTQTQEMIRAFLPLVVMILIFYFGLIRPQKKKEKEIDEMRGGLKVGDEVVTVGGITGKIVQVKKDMVVIETSGMKTRLEIMKWGISSVTKHKGKNKKGDTVDSDIEEQETEDTETIVVETEK